MSTSTWSAPATSRRAASIVVNAGDAACMNRLPREVHDAERDAVALDHAGAAARLRAHEVGRPEDVGLLVEVGLDLAVAVGVVAERDHVDAGGEQLVGVLRRDADAASGVLAVDDDEVEPELLAQARQQRLERRRPGRGRRRRRRRGSRSPGKLAHRGAYWGMRASSPTRGDLPSGGAPERRGAEDALPSTRRRSRRRGRAGGGAALGPARAAAARAARGLRARPRGRRGAAAVPHRRADRAAPQPARDAAAARRLPARRSRWRRCISCCAGAGRRRHPARQPDRRSGVVVPATTCPRSSTTRTARSRLPGLARPQRHRRAGQGARARPRCRDARRPAREGSGELVAFTRDALQRLVEASIALILMIVVSVYMLLYGERIGDVVRRIVPRGDGTPEDDFPTRIQGAVFGYVRGQLLFSLIMGTSAGVCLWILGSLGIFPEGKTYALALRRVLRLRGADPVHRAGGRRVPAGADRAVQRRAARRAVARDRVHRAAADRGPRRRADTCSATRCASTRCW